MTAPAEQSLSREQLLHLLEQMLLIREFEEEVHRSFMQSLVHGTTHLCQGQEAVSVGVAAALRPDDYSTYTYRGHGHCLAKGMSPERMFAELFGRSTGIVGGKGGSMHLTDPSRGLMGSFGIVGAGMPVAVGLGLSAKLRKSGQVSVTFFGDGATNIGAFHEAMNMASVFKAPVLFVVENNLYGEFSRIDHTTPFEDLARRAAAYDMPGVIVDGNDVLAVLAAATAAVERARSGGGPTFLECKTYRHRGHSRTDPAKYRPDEEVQEWLKRDPIERFRGHLEANGTLDAAGFEAMAEQVRAALRKAKEAAAEAPWPEVADLGTGTYAS